MPSGYPRPTARESPSPTPEAAVADPGDAVRRRQAAQPTTSPVVIQQEQQYTMPRRRHYRAVQNQAQDQDGHDAHLSSWSAPIFDCSNPADLMSVEGSMSGEPTFGSSGKRRARLRDPIMATDDTVNSDISTDFLQGNPGSYSIVGDAAEDDMLTMCCCPFCALAQEKEVLRRTMQQQQQQQPALCRSNSVGWTDT
ncbi:hypothetical protein PG994_008070 [Apiospora phragmitis]|uniref:Uncharacterized protein n=1 Tax=Apiospora phragmitis TaxID=2905665 RepID=A0ABR1US07_9PEZI